ncbi:unnamed protein product [Pneumocystis jirovecii]|uniref:Uncharacterized protein n=1 Tax=Pneumocystis jirovecii TaxID=42068 RepID=L0P946_PNEJI|nr:unnamed protein product [Pneumocystis jirovecii]
MNIVNIASPNFSRTLLVACDLVLRLFSSSDIIFSYFQPISLDNLPIVQNLRPGLSLKARRADGTTSLFCLSYGGGIPSKTLSRSKAAAPRAVL